MAKKMSALTAVARLLTFVGLWAVFMGASEIYGADSTEALYRGTVLATNQDSRQIITNTREHGLNLVLIGIGVLLAAGAAEFLVS